METDRAPWIVAVGASGPQGLTDIRALLASLPAALNASILVVLHRPWEKPSQLREVLQRGSHHPIVVADDGERFAPGVVYIGEPAQHLSLAANTFGEAIDDPGRTHSNRTVDLLFRSVAEHGRGCVIGVVLSGSLDDGSRGLELIHKAGGLTMVLTPEAGERGMPENAIAYDGPIDLIGSPAEIGAAIVAAIKEAQSKSPADTWPPIADTARSLR